MENLSPTKLYKQIAQKLDNNPWKIGGKRSQTFWVISIQSMQAIKKTPGINLLVAIPSSVWNFFLGNVDW